MDTDASDGRGSAHDRRANRGPDTYLELPDGGAFLTAQIGGHEVVYSVILDTAKDPFSRVDVERHFERELRPVPNRHDQRC
jgi:hypothetical protein